MSKHCWQTHKHANLLQANDVVHHSLIQTASAANLDAQLVQTLLDKSIPTGCGLAGTSPACWPCG